MNKGSSLITEYDTTDLSLVREIAWSGVDSDEEETHFEIHCGTDELVLVDGAENPGLLTIAGLDGSNPTVTDHTSEVAGVGGLALNAASTDLYYWQQSGWLGGNNNSDVLRLDAAEFSELDFADDTFSDFGRPPLDAPILLDEENSLRPSSEVPGLESKGEFLARTREARDVQRDSEERDPGGGARGIAGYGGADRLLRWCRPRRRRRLLRPRRRDQVDGRVGLRLCTKSRERCESEGRMLLMASLDTLPIVVIGAGPVGLSAAVRLLERGLEPLLLEAAADVAASPRDWGHVRLFSPWRFNVDKAAVELLQTTGWVAPPLDDLPTGHELYRNYLRPLAALSGIRDRLHLDRRVVAITRHGVDKVRTAKREDAPFLVRATSASGITEEFLARAVIDATGTWWSPNPLGAAGIPAIGEATFKDRIHYGIPDVLDRDRSRYASKTTLVVGAGHSAANAILGLAELAKTSANTSIIWATRSDNLMRVFGGGDGDALPARGRLGAELRALTENGSLSMVPNFRIEALREVADKLDVAGTRGGKVFVLSGVDSVIASTGQRPDLALTRELRLALDPALESAEVLGPLIDPNEHSCGTVRPHGARELAHPEPNFFIIGSKSYGRAPTFLLATGYEQARSVAAMIAGDEAGAARVELELPETGVCNSNLQADTDDAGGCCVPGKKSCC